ncbi:hypothetical protein [Bernardetia sp. MNP-M8]|uniref:hypothetical protein n=1 Tax=Bernardetia sp. MNP-M8 TaxID=3127470 RepID=UPI0030D45554
MIDQSIFIIVDEQDLQKVITQLIDSVSFIQPPVVTNNKFCSDLWLKYKDEKFYFSLYSQEIDNKVILDFDCVDRQFSTFLVENPKSTLQFFLTSVVKGYCAYWVVNPPDLELETIYKELTQSKERKLIEVSWLVFINELV